MDDVRIEVQNLKELQQAIRRVGDRELAGQLRAANKGLADVVVREALPHVPVGETGRLRKTVRALGGQRDAKAQAGTPARVPYAATIHWGRKRGNVGRPPANRKGANVVVGRPFLWDAKERVMATGEGIREYEQRLEKLLDQVRSRNK